MHIGIPKESIKGEQRVAVTPKTVKQLLALGFKVVIEQNAGVYAGFDDASYQAAGATMVDTQQAWAANIVLKVNAPQWCDTCDETRYLKPNSTLICFFYPKQQETLLEHLNQKRINVLAMDQVPRISRAQSLDALSAMANIAGYRAVIEAAHEFGRFLSGQITAAGKIAPAKVLVIGAGVAGLAAIGAAKSLGAVVRAFDVRSEVKEQVESMGATFLSVDIQADNSASDGYAKETSETFNQAAAQLYAEQAKDVDIIITTALIPNRPAPLLLTKAMVDSMATGSIIVDLAAANGGNCHYTQANQVVTTPSGIKIIGHTDLANQLPTQASQLYATNLVNLLKLLSPQKDGMLEIDFDDVVIRTMTVCKAGEITYPPPPVQVSAAPASIKPDVESEKVSPKEPNKWLMPVFASLAGLALLGLGAVAPAEFLAHLTVFVLACIIGYYVVWNVTHALHTPLMSVTNAISGIIIVGALLQIGQVEGLISWLAFVAILVASINIFGGFAVTRRMLKLFRKDQ